MQLLHIIFLDVRFLNIWFCVQTYLITWYLWLFLHDFSNIVLSKRFLLYSIFKSESNPHVYFTIQFTQYTLTVFTYIYHFVIIFPLRIIDILEFLPQTLLASAQLSFPFHWRPANNNTHTHTQTHWAHLSRSSFIFSRSTSFSILCLEFPFWSLFTPLSSFFLPNLI